MADVLVLDTITTLRTATIPSDVDAVFVKAYSQPSPGNATRTRGGGLFQRVPAAVTPPFGDDGVFTFQNGTTPPNISFWTRNLNGGVVDAYMAGAIGGATLNANGTLASGTDDSAAINAYLEAVFNYVNKRANSMELRFALGEGTFYVANPLWLERFETSYRSWVIDGTGTTILGACPNSAILDLTDRRFGTVRNLQIIGLVDALGLPISSCGIRVGRNADNGAANHMTMDHVGIRGSFHVAAMLNVGSEQFAAIGCEFANEAAGETYGYAGDGYNCLQWSRPLAIQSITGLNGGNFSIIANGNTLQQNDAFVIRGEYGAGDVMNSILFTKTDAGTGNTFSATANFNTSATFTGGSLYKRRFGGAVDTPAFWPWRQNSHKQQYHLQGNYRAPRGVAGVFETCDSQHVFQMVHPTCSYYPDATAAGVLAAKAAISAVTLSTATLKTTTVTVPTPPGVPFADGELVSIYNVKGAFADDINERLFIVANRNITTGKFELRDIDGSAVDSTAWSQAVPDLTKAVVVRQKVAGGDDPHAGGFGMRIIVGKDTGCDVSSYLVHHESGSYTVKDPDDDEVVYGGETTWWASVESFEGWRDQGTTGFAPSPVQLFDVSFSEAAAHGRGGFLLARRETTSKVTMLGGKIALTHAARQFGNTGSQDKLLMSSGTGDSLWTLANTDLVVDTAALADTSRMAAFSGRLSAGDRVFSFGQSLTDPGVLAVRRRLSSRRRGRNSRVLRMRCGRGSRRGQVPAGDRAFGSIIARAPLIRHDIAARALSSSPDGFACSGR